MPYTKKQLIDAFCEARGCEKKDLPKIRAVLQERLDRQREHLQARLAEMPTNAAKEMKKIALNHLNQKAAEQVIAENEGVDIE